MMTENIRKTNAFIKEKFLLDKNGDMFDWTYRYEHSLRVAGIGQRIAQAEGLDEEALIIACLLHDIGYVACKTKEDHDIHGRLSAQIAREFLTSIEFEHKRIDTICYGIKIHTEPEENYERTPTPFEVSISDADDIDRFDAYRLYGNLQYAFHLDEMTPVQMLEFAKERAKRYEKYIINERGTNTATIIWKDIMGYYMEYFKRLKTQMEYMRDFCDALDEGKVIV